MAMFYFFEIFDPNLLTTEVTAISVCAFGLLKEMHSKPFLDFRVSFHKL